MLGYIGIGLVSFVVGLVIGALIYRNNAKKIETEAEKRIVELKDELDRVMRIASNQRKK